MDKELVNEIKNFFKGEILNDGNTLAKYSRDAGLFEVRPRLVAFPKDSEDVKNLVVFLQENQQKYPDLAITGRSAGTDMTGGAIGEGIILDFTKYFNKEEVDLENLKATVEPGVFYRDFEKETLPEHISMPVYPASKSLAAFGGMIMNNCGGEKTLRFGQMRNFVNKVWMILADGNEYEFKKLTRAELEEKMVQKNFEGKIYREMFKLLDKNHEKIKLAKPNVPKNSSGYALWDVYDKETDTFDLAQLFVGSQGTLGILTRAEIRLVQNLEHERMIVLFLKDWNHLPEIVNKTLPLKLQSMETFDDTTLLLGMRFMPEIAKRAGKSFFAFAKQFLPEVGIGIRMLGLPKLIILLEIAEASAEEADKKVIQTMEVLRDAKVWKRVIPTSQEAEKYWVMRRESFSLLREKVRGKRTAPFIDDFCIQSDKLPEFLPKLLKILDHYDIKVNIAGHAGSGNLHIIPLMDLTNRDERDKIPVVADKVYDLIIQYKGSITAEHNDGIIRTPYVEKMFGSEIYHLFEKVKNIFDPHNIFNPGKKVGGTLEYLRKHIARG